MNEKTSIPAAIVLAGVIIAGAILLSRSSGTLPSDGRGKPTPRPASLLSVARDVKLNTDDFTKCVKERSMAPRVQEDLGDAERAGGQGTPYTVIIGPKGETIPFSGAQPYDNVKKILDDLLAGKAPEQPLPTLAFRPVDPQRDHIRGSRDAPVTLLEYSDLECPFCKQFHTTLQRATQEYDGKVRWVYRHFPLDALHSKARKEAEAAECAAAQGKFWEFLDRLFAVAPSNNGLEIDV